MYSPQTRCRLSMTRDGGWAKLATERRGCATVVAAAIPPLPLASARGAQTLEAVLHPPLSLGDFVVITASKAWCRFEEGYRGGHPRLPVGTAGEVVAESLGSDSRAGDRSTCPPPLSTLFTSPLCNHRPAHWCVRVAGADDCRRPPPSVFCCVFSSAEMRFSGGKLPVSHDTKGGILLCSPDAAAPLGSRGTAAPREPVRGSCVLCRPRRLHRRLPPFPRRTEYSMLLSYFSLSPLLILFPPFFLFLPWHAKQTA